jgi:hypothetical protein
MGIRWWPTDQCCQADRTFTSSVREANRGNPPKLISSRMIMHIRGTERFWHWADQVDNLVKNVEAS